jgi:hypothetical protein
MAIHRPYPDKMDLMLDSMRRFGAALKKQPGLREVYQLRNRESGAWEPHPPEVFCLTPM